ncbi:alanine racemase [Elongatibacter sediminis]|uniref:Alanine racemase n=1 Tax=Elongatibacter sediminis TaxID=3119006 RepID=A0AAW9RCH2_9GAMM
MTLNDLETPALVLDLDRLEANLDGMVQSLQPHGVALRPHLKTAKSATVARLTRDRGARGIAVATLKEAEYFLENGFTDIQYPVCIVPSKFDRAARLIRNGAQLEVIVDSLEVARSLARYAADQRVAFRVYLEVDCGEHRTGFSAADPAFVGAGETLRDGSHTDLRGVLTHAGHAYSCTDPHGVRAVADEERQAAVIAANVLRTAGLPCPEVSIGSTPTARFGESFEGVTEVRAGVFLFGDLFQAGLGTCGHDDIAVSVLASTISRHPEEHRLVIDAGGLALSKDRSRVESAPDSGYGRILRIDGTALAPTAHVAEVHQEHGEISTRGIPELQDAPIGSRLRILPNHACMTAAMYDRYHVVRGTGTEILAEWDKTTGW